MKQTSCDRCGLGIKHTNKVHVYNYNVHLLGRQRKVNRPRRDDFDLCPDCRKELMKWFEFKNPAERYSKGIIKAHGLISGN